MAGSRSRPAWPSLLPFGEIARNELAMALDVDAVRFWAGRWARRDGQAGTQALLIAAAEAARRCEDGSTRYRLEIADDAPDVDKMCGRLMTAILNNDSDIGMALVEVYLTLNPFERRDVLASLALQARR